MFFNDDIIYAGGAKPSDSNGGGGTGNVVQAVNRTGGLINSGDKVWIIPQAQQAGEGFTFLDTGTVNNTNFLTDNNCDYIRHSSGLYYLGNGSSELIKGGFSTLSSRGERYLYGSVSASITKDYKVNILFNGEVIVPEYSGSTTDTIIPSDSSTMVYWYSNSNETIFSYNLETKETKQYANTDSLTWYTGFLSIKSGYLYSSYSNAAGRWYAKIDEGSASFTKVGDLTVTGLNQIAPIGVTDDGNLMGIYTKDATSGVVTATFTSESELHINTAEEANGLEECYYTTSNVVPVFFPDCQILTYVKWNSSSTINAFVYGVFKYLGDKKWQKLNVILPEESPENLGRVATQFYGYLAVSTDMSKCIVGYYVTSARVLLYRYQLESFDGNNIYKYRREVITENCLTGKANQNIPSGQTGEVSTVL